LKPKQTDPVVFGFLDYREYLKALYDSRREASSVFSYRFMAQRLDVDAGQLARILQGKLHLPQRALAAAIQLCRLEGREAAYFEELVRHGRAKNPEETARSLERLEALKVPAPCAVPPDQAAYYGQWHHSLVRALAALEGIPQDPETIARSCRRPVSPEDVSKSLSLLEGLGLLVRDASGRLLAGEPHLTPGDGIDPGVLREWHAQAMEEARRALAEIPPTERDLSTVTLALNSTELATVREWVADLRRQVRALSARTEKPDRVYQVNVQFFPVAKRAKTKRPG
jgi:uncharacterized protein (TIGR02147 family)